MSKSDSDNKKRHGKHHRHNKRYIKVYAPYLPLLISILASLLITFIQPVAGKVLPYATNMSVGGLLSATNSQRGANGVGGLSLNAQLVNAAQAKANDMVTRDYWSHNTPDGQPPWVFIDNAGYHYVKAGENLAYGFATSADTVNGWMNSPTHKANMLDGAYSDVGFGFANSANFNGDGEQTVVVAMYGAPQTAPAVAPSSPEPTPPPAPSPSPQPEPAAPSTPAPTETPAPTPEPESQPAPVTTDNPIAAKAPRSQAINRSQALTGIPWALGIVTALLGSVLAFRLLHMGIRLKHMLKHHPKLQHILAGGERFILHHPLLDSTIAGLALLSYTLSQVVGVIL